MFRRAQQITCVAQNVVCVSQMLSASQRPSTNSKHWKKNATFQKSTFFVVFFSSLGRNRTEHNSFVLKKIGLSLIMTMSSPLFIVMDSKSQTRGAVNLVGLWLITLQSSWKSGKKQRDSGCTANTFFNEGDT